MDVRAEMLVFPGFGGLDRSFCRDVRLDILVDVRRISGSKTYSLGCFFVLEKHPQNNPILKAWQHYKNRGFRGPWPRKAETLPKFCVFLPRLQHNCFGRRVQGGHLINSLCFRAFCHLIWTYTYIYIYTHIYLSLFSSSPLPLCVSLSRQAMIYGIEAPNPRSSRRWNSDISATRHGVINWEEFWEKWLFGGGSFCTANKARKCPDNSVQVLAQIFCPSHKICRRNLALGNVRRKFKGIAKGGVKNRNKGGCKRLSAFVHVCSRLLAFSPLRFRLCVCLRLSAFVCVCLRLLAFAYPPLCCAPLCVTLKIMACRLKFRGQPRWQPLNGHWGLAKESKQEEAPRSFSHSFSCFRPFRIFCLFSLVFALFAPSVSALFRPSVFTRFQTTSRLFSGCHLPRGPKD